MSVKCQAAFIDVCCLICVSFGQHPPHTHTSTVLSVPVYMLCSMIQSIWKSVIYSQVLVLSFFMSYFRHYCYFSFILEIFLGGAEWTCVICCAFNWQSLHRSSGFPSWHPRALSSVSPSTPHWYEVVIFGRQKDTGYLVKFGLHTHKRYMKHNLQSSSLFLRNSRLTGNSIFY